MTEVPALQAFPAYQPTVGMTGAPVVYLNRRWMRSGDVRSFRHTTRISAARIGIADVGGEEFEEVDACSIAGADNERQQMH